MTKSKQRKVRADQLIVDQGLAPDLESARKMLLAGRIELPDGSKPTSSTMLPHDLQLAVKAKALVSRGGEKLQHALDTFSLSPQGKICADFGASTGGFTECLLKNGASKVYAIDTAKGELAWKLRTDPRVVTIEETNVLHPPVLPELIEFASIDLSFTSLTKALPAISPLLLPDAPIIALIKPQYEAPELLGSGGIVPDLETREEILKDLFNKLDQLGFNLEAQTTSPILGGGGNTEYLGYFLGESEAKLSID